MENYSNRVTESSIERVQNIIPFAQISDNLFICAYENDRSSNAIKRGPHQQECRRN